MNQEKTKVIDVGYILGSGQVVGVNELKALMDNDSTGSKQIQDDEFDYKEDGVVEPPFSLSNLISLLDANAEHGRCVRAKATDIVGHGWQVVKEPELKDSQVNKKDKQTLEDFFKNCNDDMPFDELLNRTMLDLEATGNGYIEVARNVKGYPAKLYHIDASTVRVREGHTGFVQRIDNKKVYFQNFGDKVRVDENGKVQVRTFIDPATGKEKKSLGMLKSANELIQFKQYRPGNNYYGGPDYLPALKPIIGSESAENYNIQFFDNNAVPQYAIVIYGAKLSTELKNLIEMYFRTEIKGKAHKTLILPIPFRDVKVEFKALSTEGKEGSFLEYRKNNRDEVLVAHGVPPHRIGIIETASLGSGTGESQNETYKRSIIEPRQLVVESKLTRTLIQQGFGIYGWIFKFEDIDYEDEKQQSEIAEKYSKMGAITINEIRTEFMGKTAVPGGDRPFIVVGNQIFFVDELGEAAEESKELDILQKQYYEIVSELEVLRERNN